MKNKTFDDRIRELEAFKAEHGHCEVPAKRNSLGAWIVNFRQAMQGGRTGILVTPDRIKRLVDLGVRLDNRDIFEERFRELLAFKAEHGHCNPQCALGALGSWLSGVRRQVARSQCGQKHTITLDQIKRLTDLGVSLSGGSSGTSFERRYSELTAFKTKHGHCNIPVGTSLWWWLVNIRRGFISGGTKRVKVTPEQLQRLKDLEVPVGGRAEAWSGIFEQRFKEIQAFKAEHGHCDITPTGSALWQWIYRIRKAAEKNAPGALITPEQIQRLRDLGVSMPEVCAPRPPKSPPSD
jgi:hypothetical protein